MKLANKQIAIIGGGPGGLTLARLLQLQGLNVKLFERDMNKDARVQGSPLDMHEGSGLAALREAELLDVFRQNFLPGADKELIVNPNLEVFFSDHGTKAEEDFGAAHFRPEIDRGTLRHILLESLQPDTVIWDSQFVSMQQEAEGWRLLFKNGLSYYADLVIGAEGANSKIRPYITAIKPFYSGITMLEGLVNNAEVNAPHINSIIKGGKIMAFGNEQNLLLGQKGNGDLGFYASMKVEENWAVSNGLDYANNLEVLAWFKREYAEWSPLWHELFEHASQPFVPRVIYCMPLDQDWETLPNLTMIGDAAHVMPPFAGEGANMAMLDALMLSESLRAEQHHTLHEALADFEVNMRSRASKAAAESLANGALMHSACSLSAMVEMFSRH